MPIRSLRLLLLSPLLLTIGCGGSGGNDASPAVAGTPTGGGGTISEYVESYGGTVETMPTSGASATVGTVSLTVAADGTVTGIRHLTAKGKDEALSGTISDQGRLSLSRPGGSTTGTIPLRGYLAKASDGTALTVLLESPDLAENGGLVDAEDSWAAYRLTGGSGTAGAAPLTTGLWQGGLASETYHLGGDWSAGGTSGAVSLDVSRAGRVSGSWTDASGKRSVSGVLYDVADGSGLSYAGTLTIGSQTVEARFGRPTSGTFIGIPEFVGTVTTPDGAMETAVYLKLRS